MDCNARVDLVDHMGYDRCPEMWPRCIEYMAHLPPNALQALHLTCPGMDISNTNKERSDPPWSRGKSFPYHLDQGNHDSWS